MKAPQSSGRSGKGAKSVQSAKRMEKLRELGTEMAAIERLIEKKYGKHPKIIGSEMDDICEVQDKIFRLFKISGTGRNQVLLYEILKYRMDEKSWGEAYSILERLSDEAARERASPLETIMKGIELGMEAGDVLPKIGISNHVYPMFLYDRIVEDHENLIPCYEEMKRAEPLLGAIAMLKIKFDKLEAKNISMLREFIDFDA